MDHTWLPDGRLALALSDRRLLIVDGVAVSEVQVTWNELTKSFRMLRGGRRLRHCSDVDLSSTTSTTPHRFSTKYSSAGPQPAWLLCLTVAYWQPFNGYRPIVLLRVCTGTPHSIRLLGDIA